MGGLGQYNCCQGYEPQSYYQSRHSVSPALRVVCHRLSLRKKGRKRDNTETIREIQCESDLGHAPTYGDRVLSHGQRSEHYIETLGDHGKDRTRYRSALPSSLQEILLWQRDAEHRGRETEELHVLDGYSI